MINEEHDVIISIETIEPMAPITTMEPLDPNKIKQPSMSVDEQNDGDDDEENENEGDIEEASEEIGEGKYKPTTEAATESTESTENHANETTTKRNSSRSKTRFKWTEESAKVATNLVKHGCETKLVSVAVGCSLRTAQKFVETVKPKMAGESFKEYTIRRRGRKSRDVNQRLEAIREVLSKDSSKTQVQIAADLKVSNTTVCRDLKKLGASWKRNDSNKQSSMKQRDTKK